MDELRRNCLQNFNGDVFEMIKKAIMVAASDHPQEFRQKREMIAQTLFSSCQLTKPSTSGRREKCNPQSSIKDINVGTGGETKIIVSEVLKMKAILERRGSHESESVLLDSLSKLQHMVKSVDVLKLTGVGRSVNALGNHGSKNVANVSRKLVKQWKFMVDGWLKDTEKIPPSKIEKQKINEPRISNKEISRPMVVRIKLKKEPAMKDDNAFREVLRIKEILDKGTGDKSVLLASLMKLANIRLSVKALEEIGIGKSIRALQKQGSKDVRQIAWALINKLKLGVVDEYDVKKEESSVALKPTGLNTETKIEKEKPKNEKTGASDDGEKFQAARKRLREAIEEAERMKKKRRIQVIEFHELNKKQVELSKKRFAPKKY